MTELERGKNKVETAVSSYKTGDVGLLKIAVPTPEALVKDHPYLKDVVHSGTKVGYAPNGDLIATNAHLQICLTSKQLPHAVTVNSNNAKPQIIIGPSKLPSDLREDLFNEALAHVCGGDYSKSG